MNVVFDRRCITSRPTGNHIMSGGNCRQRCRDRAISTNRFARKIQVRFHHDDLKKKKVKS
jgi:hypothetical protein